MSGEFQVRPSFAERFPSSTVKTMLRDVLKAELTGVSYDVSSTPDQSKRIADAVRNQLKNLALPRYKFMVQVVVGEQRGEGVRMGCRTFWDTDTDAYASDTFINVSGGTHTPACAIALPF